MVDEAKLAFWIKNNKNVMFTGKHGVGKTSVILNAFNNAGLKWKYFSGATLDPWVDFVGVPRKVVVDGKEILDFIRPANFNEDEVEAIFIDEYNRSHKKVRNATMELIQFKSINGRKFPNLRIVWTAVNPHEEGVYNVDEADPAQQDRFQIHVNIPYEPSIDYFNKKYGEIGLSAIEWWKSLNDVQKDLVSPRRLDYALEYYKQDGDIRDILHESTNVSKLIDLLNDISPIKKLNELVYKYYSYTKSNKDEKDVAKVLKEIKKLYENENSFAHILEHTLSLKSHASLAYSVMPKEKLMSIIAVNNKDMLRHKIEVVYNSIHDSNRAKVVEDMLAAKKDKFIVELIKKSTILNRFYNDGAKDIFDILAKNFALKIKDANHITSNDSVNINIKDLFKQIIDLQILGNEQNENRKRILDTLNNGIINTVSEEDGYRILSILEQICFYCQPIIIEANLSKVLNCLYWALKSISEDSEKVIRKYYRILRHLHFVNYLEL